MHVPRLAILAGLVLAHGVAAGPKPVEFQFIAPDSTVDPNPYSREIWARVTTPSGQTLTLPAYYAAPGLFAVRARPDEIGIYHFGSVSETTKGVRAADLIVSLVTPADYRNTSATRLPSVLRNPANPRQLMRSDGHPYVPVGTNLAWAPDNRLDRTAYYHQAFPAFGKANLNWMRIWMAHWDGLNLDWLPLDMGPSPKPGAIEPQVADNWDQILSDAEESGVYVQVVLQHHGQYTTSDDANWAENPWNIANPGGFLRSPVDFFTDPNAKVITLLKYRYIVARWGWSPAVVAWELFNEVNWTDAMRQGREDDVARWHDTMATFIRSVDVYGHLITTSTDNLRSPIYDKMDFYQPHLYTANMVAGSRVFDKDYSALDRPIFYGEEGDDHEPLSAEVKKSGVDLVSPIWASVMGQGDMAAQPWNGWQLLEQDRLGELGSVYRFLVMNRVASQPGLRPFSSVVACREQVPLRIVGGEYWQHAAPVDIDFPVDGTETLGEANVAAIMVGPANVPRGYPDRATYRLDLPRRTRMRIELNALAPQGAGVRVSIDGAIVATHRWAGGTAVPNPAELEFPVDAGRHTLLAENPGPDWIGVTAIDLGIPTSALALIGRRNDRFIEAWVWHRANLYSLAPSAPVTGTVSLENVSAGSWKVTWWDTLKGVPSESRTVVHPGGTLRIGTPPISRHAAVVLVRQS